MEFSGGDGIKREIELILPPKFKPRFGEGIVPILRAGMALRQVRRVRRNFVSGSLARRTEADGRRWRMNQSRKQLGAVILCQPGRADAALPDE